MKGTLQQAVVNALDYLMLLSRESIRPEEARARLRLLRQQHPDIGMELLWEEEAYDQSVHYDALLDLDGAGTVSVSFCPDKVLPWPMRGVHRWSDADLLRVNHTVLRVDQAIACLDYIWDEARIIDRLVHACLIQEALEKDPVPLSDEELQVAMDGFRRAHRLYTIEDTHRWLERHGCTHEQLERRVGDEAIVAKLRDRVTEGRVEDYFERHRADFDTAGIAQFALADEASARRAYEQIRGGELDFYEAAQGQFLAAAQGATPTLRAGTRPPRELFAVVERGQAPPELAAAVFAARPGEVVGPVRTGEEYAVVRVLSSAPGRLDERTRRAIQKLLFEEWLEERRQAATIEWNWGNASGTS
jgi:putative peptide maturation system protein